MIIQLATDDMMTYQMDLIDLLTDAVNGGASVSFLAPLKRDDAAAFWQKVAADMHKGERILLVALEDERVIGSVQLVLATQPNAPHRAEVQKLLVHSQHRRKGIGRQLMLAIEDCARQINRWLIVLDTASRAAEQLYEQVGYIRLGVIPEFALNASGIPEGTTVYYKRLKA